MFSYSYGGWKSSARQNKTTGAILVSKWWMEKIIPAFWMI